MKSLVFVLIINLVASYFLKQYFKSPNLFRLSSGPFEDIPKSAKDRLRSNYINFSKGLASAFLFSSASKSYATDKLTLQSQQNTVDTQPNYVDVKLQLIDDVYCMNYTLINENKDIREYRAIVDTGSPFLIVPSICTKLWGCGKSNLYVDTGLDDTIEIFGGQNYDSQWKLAQFQFLPYQVSSSSLSSSSSNTVNKDTSSSSSSSTKSNIYNTYDDDDNHNKLGHLLSYLFPSFKNIFSKSYTYPSKDIIFAQVGVDVLRPPGGVFIGLVKYKQDRIRPTLLEQLDFSSFALDTKYETLRFSKESMIPTTTTTTTTPTSTTSSSTSSSSMSDTSSSLLSSKTSNGVLETTYATSKKEKDILADSSNLFVSSAAAAATATTVSSSLLTSITTDPTPITTNSSSKSNNKYNGNIDNSKSFPSLFTNVTDGVIPLLDLRTSGDPVYHYTAKVIQLKLNNKIITNFPIIYAVFDTGTSGCTLSDDLGYDIDTPQPIRQVEVTIETEIPGQYMIFTAKATRDKIFVVNSSNIKWFKNKVTSSSTTTTTGTSPTTTTTTTSTSTSTTISSTSVSSVSNSNSNSNPMKNDHIKTTQLSNTMMALSSLLLTSFVPPPLNLKDVLLSDQLSGQTYVPNYGQKLDDIFGGVDPFIISEENYRRPQVVVLGLAFFKNTRLIVDIDDRRLSVHQYNDNDERKEVEG